MSRKDDIHAAYKHVGKGASLYDGMITCTTPLGTAISLAVWGIGPKKNAAYLDCVMENVPEGFSGSLLEVPVGTGVLTMPLYRTLPDAQVTCLDYSPDMMGAAQARAARDGLSHVSFVQGDVGALPFDDESFDVVMSLNGFHAFPDKEAAYAETFRVLKPGGTFCGCFYVQGEVALTDWWIRRFHEPCGFFTPPYETAASLEERLRGRYAQVHVETHKAIACFVCVK
jgi:SAM-dependent methyltransferase